MAALRWRAYDENVAELWRREGIVQNQAAECPLDDIVQVVGQGFK